MIKKWFLGLALVLIVSLGIGMLGGIDSIDGVGSKRYDGYSIDSAYNSISNGRYSVDSEASNSDGHIEQEVIIILDEAFSPQGAATDIAMGYGTSINVPTATARIGDLPLDVRLDIAYLGRDGWNSYSLADNRRLVMGDVPLPDTNRTAMYKVVYSAGEGDNIASLTYTIWVGLEMFVTTDRQATAFVGDDIVLPEVLPTYKYRDGTNTTQYIDLDVVRQVVFFDDKGSAGVVIDSDINTVKPREVGTYIATFVSPSEITKDGVVYVGDSVSVSASITVRDERISPIVGSNGLYKTGFEISGTSDIGKAMIASSTDKELVIRKQDGLYKLSFTVTAADMIRDVNISFGGDIFKIEQSDVVYDSNKQLQSYSIYPSSEALQGSLGFGMYVVPMGREINFELRADLDNAYLIEQYDNNDVGTEINDSPIMRLRMYVAIAVAVILVGVVIAVVVIKVKKGNNG